VVQEPATERVEPLLRRDPELVIWWGTALECAGALAAAKRKGWLAEAGVLRAQTAIEHLRERAFEVQPTAEVRSRALRIVSVHTLRTGAALQLAAALVWCRERTHGVSFICLDGPLRLAAGLEGFRVQPYADEVHEPGFSG
jgi:hypothetical protein